MSELRELYQEVILDHGKNPRNFGELEGADHRADGHNPLCGDRITVYVKAPRDIVEEVGFDGAGCAISTASASMMTQALRGKPVEECREIFEAFHDLLTGKRELDEVGELLGKLQVFSGVREFPIRVKCATLAWHTLRAALDRESEAVTTE
jgi:nitrogen fixation NifU-like protein